jgi:hypothetical protein
MCSYNSPKQKCETSRGNWSNSATCQIQECSLGCCILSDQATVATSRECTNLANQLNLKKDFQPLDADGSCNSKLGLLETGACLYPSNDFSGENDCKFTSKAQCSGTFYKDVLCTSKALNTNCKPAKNTTCVETKDQVYYLDSCGNTANVYDANRYNDTIYWDKIIPTSNSCSPSSKDCGNCNYLTGSICSQYKSKIDTKPTIGNNVCRDLNCKNGKKNGESWCVSDYSNRETSAVAPIGSRWFKGICFDGEISIEPCADFNNEICIDNSATSGNSSGFSEAKCIINDWRSCISANEKKTYDEVKNECEKYSQCVMFLDIEGNEKYENLAGFIKGEAQVGKSTPRGNAGSIGEGENKVMAFCVPKFTPGLIFWNNPLSATGTQKTATPTTPTTKTTASTTAQNNGGSSLGYGGTIEETKAICALGSFSCVSHLRKDNPNSPGAKWEDKENAECNIDAANSESKEKVPLLLEALNERCRSLGPCGVYTNVAGELGSNNGSSITRVKIDAKGKTKNNFNTDGYSLTEEYVSSLVGKPGVIAPGNIKTLTALVVFALTGRAISGFTVGPVPGTTAGPTFATEATATGTGSASIAPTANLGGEIMYTSGASTTGAGATSSVTAGGVTGSGATGGGAAGGGGAGASSGGLMAVGTAVGYAAAAAFAGYQVGQLIGKKSGMTPGETESLSYSLAVLGGGTVLASSSAVVGTAATSTTAGTGLLGMLGPWASIGGACWPCLVAVVIAAILTYMFTGQDNAYYIINYKCEPWKAPQIGNCNLCNDDVRTCSEYRCKSLGLNCQYFNDNGEPGWCAENKDIWSAKITPWPEAISNGLKYTDIADTHFSIQGSASIEVPAWTTLDFGIITDKPAQCKIDNKHTKTFDEMSTSFNIDSESCQTSVCSSVQGTHHKISLSEILGTNTTATYTLGMVEGENNYYIRCKNFAGQENAAEFAIKIIVAAGPDLTPPLITAFNPKDNSYLKVGTNSSNLVISVNEAADCRYSQSVDNRFEDMGGRVTCINDPSMVILGSWPCYATLGNLTIGSNQFYFQCSHPPTNDPRTNGTTIINRNSKVYNLNVCSQGLNITKLEPKDKIITGKSPISLTLEAQTSGCIDNGKAVCYYRFNSGADIAFLNTDSTEHSQIFNNLAAGVNNITVSCIDAAGNTANESIKLNVYLDNQAPVLLRAFSLNQKLTVITDETSECKYIDNSTTGCNFNFDTDNSNLMENTANYHYATWNENKDYYIKCRDIYNNTNLNNCLIAIKTY